MQTFKAQFYDFKKKMFEEIAKDVETYGVPSQFNNGHKVIKIDDEDLQYTLQDDRYLIEVGSVLVDNKGYTYAREVLPIDQLIEITDYILNK